VISEMTVLWSTVDLGRIGVWCSGLRHGPETEAVEAAREIEALGFSVAWMPGGGPGLGHRLAALLAGTERLVIAVGVVSIWAHPATEVAAMASRIEAAHPGRLLLGFGIGHRPPGSMVSLGRYLDQLDGAPQPLPAASRFLAALGPRMLALAAARSRGAHPYLVTPEHARKARSLLGARALLAPEQHVVLDADPARARALAREYLGTTLLLPNYRRSLARMGFPEEELSGGGSDTLVDALVAWGGPEAALERVREHLEAGADHVGVQVLVPGRRGFPLDGWRRLAAARDGLSSVAGSAEATSPERH